MSSDLKGAAVISMLLQCLEKLHLLPSQPSVSRSLKDTRILLETGNLCLSPDILIKFIKRRLPESCAYVLVPVIR